MQTRRARTVVAITDPRHPDSLGQKFSVNWKDECITRAIRADERQAAVFGMDGFVQVPPLYRTRHFLWLLLRLLRDRRAARVACSNTSRTPSLVLAEHSRYLYAPIFLRISSP